MFLLLNINRAGLVQDLQAACAIEVADIDFVCNLLLMNRLSLCYETGFAEHHGCG